MNRMYMNVLIVVIIHCEVLDTIFTSDCKHMRHICCKSHLNFKFQLNNIQLIILSHDGVEVFIVYLYLYPAAAIVMIS